MIQLHITISQGQQTKHCSCQKRNPNQTEISIQKSFRVAEDKGAGGVVVLKVVEIC